MPLRKIRWLADEAAELNREMEELMAKQRREAERRYGR
jgi:hypothetical protein